MSSSAFGIIIAKKSTAINCFSLTYLWYNLSFLCNLSMGSVIRLCTLAKDVKSSAAATNNSNYKDYK